MIMDRLGQPSSARQGPRLLFVDREDLYYFDAASVLPNRLIVARRGVLHESAARACGSSQFPLSELNLRSGSGVPAGHPAVWPPSSPEERGSARFRWLPSSEEWPWPQNGSHDRQRAASDIGADASGCRARM